VIDINRDTQLQDSYADVPHNLIVGIARIGGTDFRYKLYFWDGQAYSRVESIDTILPILFKPMGTPKPEANYIASDADYVDFITELMGGFSIPPSRQAAAPGQAIPADGHAPEPRHRAHGDGRHDLLGRRRPAGCFIAEPTAKERRFCARIGLEIIEADVFEFIGAAQPAEPPREPHPHPISNHPENSAMLLDRYEPYFFNSNFKEAASKAGWSPTAASWCWWKARLPMPMAAASRPRSAPSGRRAGQGDELRHLRPHGRTGALCSLPRKVRARSQAGRHRGDVRGQHRQALHRAGGRRAGGVHSAGAGHGLERVDRPGCPRKSDFKGQSSADKVVTLYNALKGHTFKYPQSTVEEALKSTNSAKRETHGAV
jgi:hypothetical protein